VTLDQPLEPITDLGLKLPLPQWDKAASVQMWLTNVVAIAVVAVGETDPGFVWPTWTHAAIPIVASIVASFAHWVIQRRAARKAQLAGARSALALHI
jgi:hypothetical protein